MHPKDIGCKNIWLTQNPLYINIVLHVSIAFLIFNNLHHSFTIDVARFSIILSSTLLEASFIDSQFD